MRIFRIVINEGTSEVGIVFELDEYENNRSGRGVVKIPLEVLEPVWKAARQAFEEAVKEVDSTGKINNLSAELYRLRVLKSRRENT